MLQVTPQLPQLKLSTVVSTQKVPHWVRPGGHTQVPFVQDMLTFGHSAEVRHPVVHSMFRQVVVAGQSASDRQPTRHVLFSQILPTPHVPSCRHPG